jgi:hypothetical protein
VFASYFDDSTFLRVWDVTDPLAPQHLEGVRFEKVGTGWGVRFQDLVRVLFSDKIFIKMPGQRLFHALHRSRLNRVAPESGAPRIPALELLN